MTSRPREGVADHARDGIRRYGVVPGIGQREISGRTGGLFGQASAMAFRDNAVFGSVNDQGGELKGRKFFRIVELVPDQGANREKPVAVRRNIDQRCKGGQQHQKACGFAAGHFGGDAAAKGFPQKNDMVRAFDLRA
ncbi:hypothetical protein GCM10007924_07540 [Sneathiella chinensis]|uniref:Uncharacterized protein n=1 Tax=Sneathiella chinensis TaxID=349750 RepID=A0ABQ5U1C9_9PROT|nr:hypothetical protein GCM10007924_07540 [Sneathiella chinensis]